VVDQLMHTATRHQPSTTKVDPIVKTIFDPQ
jgi:hypothetical protein